VQKDAVTARFHAALQHISELTLRPRQDQFAKTIWDGDEKY
jgi:hypothetical protein